MCICIDLEKSFIQAESVNVYNEGELATFSKNDKLFNVITDGWNKLIDDAHDMPAFGVSLNNLTLKELNHGLWVEFVFEKRYESNGLPYEKLLIKVEKDYYGFNIIRYNSGNGYDGRCFYYDLVNKDMSDFYNILLNI